MKRTLLSLNLFAFLLILSFSSAAQLAGWSSAVIFDVVNNSATAVEGKPIAISLNTADLIGLEKMQATGADIRFASDCDGATLFSYWIASGINTEDTKLFIKGLSVGANDSTSIYLLYGNPSAPAASDFDAVFTNQRIIASSEALTIIDTLIETDYFEISGGALVTLAPGHPGKMSVKASMIKINGVLNLDGMGYAGSAPNVNGEGPGGGGSNTDAYSSGGSGGSYGGKGGSGSKGGLGGEVYGTVSGLDIQRGSGGGGGGQNPGESGGGAVFLSATGVEINGSISVNGIDGLDDVASGGGGGSGGGVLILSQHITINGEISVRGGNGDPAGNWPGGGGGGGRVKLFYGESVTVNGEIILDGGLVTPQYSETDPPAIPGGLGILSMEEKDQGYVETRISSLGISMIVNQQEACLGDEVVFTATGSFGNFDFLSNNEIIQSGDSPELNITTLADSSTIVVENYDPAGGCRLRSKSIFMRVSPSLPVASFTSEYELFTATFTNVSENPIRYAWDFGDDIGVSDEANPVYRYENFGNYYVNLTVENGCGSATKRKLLKLAGDGPPGALFESTTRNDTTFFTDLSVNKINKYVWAFGDGDTSYAPNPKHIYKSEGPFIVCLTVENTFGSDTLCKLVELVEVTNVNSTKSEFNLKLMPNPASEVIEINSSETLSNIEIFDIQGRRVYANSNVFGKEVVQVSDWTKGFYILKAQSDIGYKALRFIVN
ncbi:MAG: PKD repeat protein [Sphingobacteriales bacterium]|jgi:PKD repeat protein